MINTLKEFEKLWLSEAAATEKVLNNLTDASLPICINADGRTLGRLGWHLVITIPEMMGRTGLEINGPAEEEDPPAKAKAIAERYHEASESLLAQMKRDWKDASLQTEDMMYGEKWKRSETLQALVFHQIHHRAQMIMLMRLAGLRVPGIYGPAREEWSKMGMKPPKI